MANWVAVVDDDKSNLQVAGRILSENDMRVTAFRSGQSLLDWMAEGNCPELILLDILMPQMDGFETLEKLQAYEREHEIEEIPVVFLTGTEDREAETRGLMAGAVDFIRKPFEAEALVKRVKNIIQMEERMRALLMDSKTDQLTGFLNQSAVSDKLQRICMEGKGALIVADLDNFKLVNDIYGHDMGDRMLTAFSAIVTNHTRQSDIVGRLGGDEFVLFLEDVSDAAAINDVAKRLNDDITREARLLMGKDMKVPLGVSMGAVFVPASGRNYKTLFKRADRALYHVKENGRHGVLVSEERDSADILADNGFSDMKSLTMIMSERDNTSNAMWIGEEAFRDIYQFMMRYIQSYCGVAYKALFTLLPSTGAPENAPELEKAFYRFGHMLQSTLRKSDIMMRSGERQYFLLLPELEEKYVQQVTSRILQIWDATPESAFLTVTYELQLVVSKKNSTLRRSRDHSGNAAPEDAAAGNAAEGAAAESAASESAPAGEAGADGSAGAQ